MASFTLRFVGALILLLSIPHTAVAERSCKALPNKKGWPALSDWAALNTTLRGLLLKPDPPAAPCHKDHPAYNKKKCKVIKANWSNSVWHSNNPVSSLFQNLNGYSCTPEGKTCSSEGYPVYVVNATTVEHVQAAVNFARERNVRLNIKSTGHDFLGKSVQPKSISIWTHHLKSQEWYESGFTPKSCNVTLDGAFVRAGSGTQMRQLYRAASDRKLMIVGGDSVSVSLGGYITGGGHSTLSPWLGMAGDHIVEVEVVTPDGNLVVANECLNPDLFWAARGGGGSTFGVTTSLVIRAHPTVPITVWQGYLFGNTSADANWDAIAHVWRQWPIRLDPLNASGYLIGPGFSMKPGAKGITTLKVLLPRSNSTDTLKTALDPILNAMRNETGGGKGKVVVRGNYTQYANYGDYLFPSQELIENGVWEAEEDTYPGNGQSKLMATWLWDAKALAHPNIRNVLKDSVDNGTIMLADFVGPSAGVSPWVRGGGNAVNPAWRGSIVRPASQMDWDEKSSFKLPERLSTLTRFGQLLRSIAPDRGTYPNEADYQTVNYQRDFWGENYPRLYDIKMKVDPQGVFYCKTCVGSELWEESAEGELCKK